MNTPEISEFEFAELVDFGDWNTPFEEDASCLCTHGHRDEKLDTCSPILNNNCQPCQERTHTRKRALKEEALSEEHTRQKQYKLSRPRIVRRDFRRDFPMMWVNVMNTGSYDFMMEHIRTFYSPDIVLRQRDLRPVDVSPAFPESRKMKGVSSFADFWYTAMHLLPDLVCSLKHSVLKIRSDGTSVINCSFVLNGTKVVRLPCGAELIRIQRQAQGIVVDKMDEASADSCAIDATVAAVAAVAPTKVWAAMHAHKSELHKQATTDSCRAAAKKAAGASNPDPNLHQYEHQQHQQQHQQQHLEHQQNHIPSASSFAAASAAARSKLLKCQPTNNTVSTTTSTSSTSDKHNATSTNTTHTSAGLNGVRADLTTLTHSQVHIPYSILRKMSPEDDNFKSLRFDNNAQLNFGMAFTAYAITKDGKGVDESVVLAGEINLFCSLEINFNAQSKVESVVLNYIT